MNAIDLEDFMRHYANLDLWEEMDSDDHSLFAGTDSPTAMIADDEKMRALYIIDGNKLVMIHYDEDGDLVFEDHYQLVQTARIQGVEDPLAS